jgi:hypothetical protein
MMSSPKLRSLVLAVLMLTAAGALSAQNKEGSKEVQGEAEREAAEAKAIEELKAGKTDDLTIDGDGTAGEAVAGNPVALTNLAFPHVTTRPRRLAPGESGSLLIVLALHSPAVVTGDAPVALTYDTQQGSLQLGSYGVQPAKPGTLETKFKGQLVHDNTMTIEIPLLVDPKAELGEVPIAMHLKTTVSHGGTGVPMGELALPINGRVKVGRTVPRPLARDATTAATSTSITAPGTAPSTLTPAPAESTDSAPAAKGAAPPILATSHDGVAMDVSLPERTVLKPGSSLTAQVRVLVPAGKRLSRADAGSLGLEVLGADAGVSVTPAGWPEPVIEEDGEDDVLVSTGELTLPVTITAAPDAAVGLRNLEFRLTYRTVAPGALPSEPQTLVLPAVLSVGSRSVVASPWLFYAAGLALALLLGVLVVRALRR